MNYIIEPEIIYLIETIDNFRKFFFIALFIVVGILIFYLIHNSENNLIIEFGALKRFVLLICLLGTIIVFIPTKKTMYTMLVFKNLTCENFKKDEINYIFDKIKETNYDVSR